MNSLFSRLAVFIVLAPIFNVHAYDHARDFVVEDDNSWPVITIIIDDIGNRLNQDERALRLPGPVAYAILPHTPHGPMLAERAHRQNKEVMLHLPLEAVENNHLLGKGAITIDDTASSTEFKVLNNLQSVPHVVGINNHMGSLLTRHPGHMRWLMQTIENHSDLFFVDSFTTGRSVAYKLAKEYGIPSIKRDIFLDSKQTHEAVARQFDRLKQHARKHGYAVAIGHPFEETLDVLETQLPRLEALGYRLVTVQAMIKRQQRSQRGTRPSTTLSVAEETDGVKGVTTHSE